MTNEQAAITAAEWARAFHGLSNDQVERAVSEAIDTNPQFPPRIATVLRLAVIAYAEDEIDPLPDRTRFLEDIEDRRRHGERVEHCFEDHPVYERALKIGGRELWAQEDAVAAGQARKRAGEAFNDCLELWLRDARDRARQRDSSDWRLVASFLARISR